MLGIVATGSHDGHTDTDAGSNRDQGGKLHDSVNAIVRGRHADPDVRRDHRASVLDGLLGDRMGHDDYKFPETITVWDKSLARYLESHAQPAPSSEWVEVAVYRLEKITRVRYHEEWEA